MIVDNKFLKNIIEFNMLKKGDKIIVGVSGGADSIYLLYNLYAIKKKYNLEIVVAHINHGIRDTAVRDENFVIEVSNALGVEVKVSKVNMNEYAKLNKLTSEEAGRELRYNFFRSLSNNRLKIFLAHNKNDQAETVLQRIIRGTGIEGLGAMSFISEDLYRPMLNISRKEIIEYISLNKIDYVDDETNFEDIYMRNKIRLNLIPYIEKNFNSNFTDALLRLSEISADNYSYISSKVSEYLNGNYFNHILNIKKLRLENNYFISEVVRNFLKLELKNIDAVSRKNILDIVKMIKESTSSKVTLPKNKEIEISYDSLFIKKEIKTIKKSQKLKYGINITDFGKIEIIDNSQYKSEYKTVSIDKDKLVGELYVRGRKNGDKFVPFGMKNSKKLKDYFIDEKIDRLKRDSIPIICDDENIIWVCPYRLSDIYKVDKNTKNILSIVWEE